MTPSQAAQEKPTSPRERLSALIDEVNAIPVTMGHGAIPRIAVIEAIETARREAAAATPSLDGSDSLTFLALSQHLDHHTPMAAVRTFPRIDCRCGWEGFDWPVHFYGSTLARLDEGSATPDQGAER